MVHYCEIDLRISPLMGEYSAGPMSSTDSDLKGYHGKLQIF